MAVATSTAAMMRCFMKVSAINRMKIIVFAGRRERFHAAAAAPKWRYGAPRRRRHAGRHTRAGPLRLALRAIHSPRKRGEKHAVACEVHLLNRIWQGKNFQFSGPEHIHRCGDLCGVRPELWPACSGENKNRQPKARQ